MVEGVAEEKRAAEAQAERLARENARIRKGQVLAACALGSWAIATVILCVWTTPFGITDAGRADFSIGNLVLAAFGGAALYALLFGIAFRDDDKPSTRKLLAVSAVIPLACLIGGFALASKHEQFDRGVQVVRCLHGSLPAQRSREAVHLVGPLQHRDDVR
jgi:peptidoglycan/LPS O-acetylase OafA/YrhL